jgi:hypothetical protein
MPNGKSMTNRKASKSELCRPVLAAAGRETGSAWGTAIEARGLTRSLGTPRAVAEIHLPPSGLAPRTLTGRMPTPPGLVRLSSGDGAEWSASVARVHYLGWLPATVLFVRIDALAGDGRLLLRLGDPSSVEVTR